MPLQTDLKPAKLHNQGFCFVFSPVNKLRMNSGSEGAVGAVDELVASSASSMYCDCDVVNSNDE